MNYPANYCVLDIETTGLSKYKDTIIEIGCIKVRNHCVIDEFQVLVDPHRFITPFISYLTGISNEMVQHEGIEISDALIALYDFLGDDIILGHNVSFDMGFIQFQSNLELGLVFDNQLMDTMKLARKLIHCENYKLVTLCQFFDVQNNQAHRALGDVYATFEVYKKLIQK